MDDNDSDESVDEELLNEVITAELLQEILTDHIMDYKFPTKMNLPKPGGNSLCWRYLDFTQLVSILEKNALHFANPSQFDDPFEGSIPEKNREKRRRQLEEINLIDEIKERVGDEQESLLEELEDSDVSLADTGVIDEIIQSGIKGMNKDLTDHISLNCWHVKKRETASMWNAYGDSEVGIVIKTTFNDLVDSIEQLDPSLPSVSQAGQMRKMQVGEVRYIEYDTEEIPSSIVHPYFFKRKSFESEDELRVADFDLDNLHPDGQYIDVDVEQLIHEIRVSPDADDWYLGLVDSVTDSLGFEIPVNRSDLQEEATY